MLPVRLISTDKHFSQVLRIVNKPKWSLSVATASQTQSVMKMCQFQAGPRHHGQNRFSNNHTTMLPKGFWENRQWVTDNMQQWDTHLLSKDCIKKKKKKPWHKTHKRDVVFSWFRNTDAPSPSVRVWMCVRRAFVVMWWMVGFTLRSQTWPGFLDSPPVFE